MGEIFAIRCAGCGVERTEHLGVGMAAQARELLGCAGCRRFVVFEEDLFAADDERRPRACPDCAGALHEVLVDADDRPSHAPIGTCPVCGGDLVGESIGLWD